MSPTHTPTSPSTDLNSTTLSSELAPNDAGLDKQAGWRIEDSEELYRIKGWGEPYFSINADGNVTVSPQGDRGGSLDLQKAGRRPEAA